MNALAWLRSRPRRPKRQPAPAALAATVEHLNTTPANDDTPQPTGFIRFDSVLTEAETEALRAQFTAIVEAAGVEPLPERFTVHTPARAVNAGAIVVEPARRWYGPCPVCSIRYSRCYCPQEGQ
jgi:hypothetical protein